MDDRSEQIINVLTKHGIIESDNDYVISDEEISLRCPIHGGRHKNFYINRFTGGCHCFSPKCCWHSSFKKLMYELKGSEASVDIKFAKTGSKRYDDIKTEYYRPLESAQLPIDFKPFDVAIKDENFKNWLINVRGFDIEDVRPFNLMLCRSGKYRGRVIIPFYDVDSRAIGFVARTLYNDKPKTINSYGFKTQKYLYNIDKFDNTSKTAIIVEGCFDAIRLWSYGYRNVLATLGAHFCEHYINLLLRKGINNVILCFDGDEAGFTAATKAAKMCLPYFNMVGIVRLPDLSDPDTLSKESIDSLINNPNIYDESIEMIDDIYLDKIKKKERNKDVSSHTYSFDIFKSGRNASARGLRKPLFRKRNVRNGTNRSRRSGGN